jgi:regulator of protease activity HflC (stomatin/prohibitin superfamily)
MISTLIFVATIVVAVYTLLSTRDSAFIVKETRYGDEKSLNFRWILKPVLIFIVGGLISSIQPFSLERVDAGHKGLKVNLTGSERGVSSYQYKTGWVIYNNWVEQMLEFPTYQQHIEYDAQEVITKGGFSATIKPSFNYSLKEESIGDMFVNLRLPTKEVEQGWLKNAIVSSVNDVANRWEVDAIFNKREEFEASIITECNKRVSKWFTVSQLRTNIVPPKALQEAIESKTKAIQQAQAEDQKAKTAEAEARKKVAIAKGDSAQMVIQANAEALSIKIRQREITPEYVEYLKAQKWNGVLPSTMTGSSGTFLNIK